MPFKDWLEIHLERVGTEIQASALSSRNQRALAHKLGDVERLSRFTRQVQEAAARADPLGPALEQAQEFHQALFEGELQEVRLRLSAKTGRSQLLLRLMLPQDALLQEFPWEALCERDTTLGFLGNSPDMILTRGVSSKERLIPQEILGEIPREVRGPVRLLAIAPSDEEALTALRVSLEESIAAGEIKWLDPLVGRRARPSSLFEQLRREPIIHILHFVGHGSVDQKGTPLLRLADEDGEEKWIPVELLAQQLRERFRDYLRLIVLDACEGARPGALASAAGWLTLSGADAVIAHLWPVKADLASVCSREFYRSLTGGTQQQGDVAYSLNQARRMALVRFGSSAEVFSPVLYLRGHGSILFKFKDPKPPSDEPPFWPAHPSTDAHSPYLHRILNRPYTLVLGDRWKDAQAVLNAFRVRLHQELTNRVGPLPADQSMSALTQHYALRFGEGELEMEFQQSFGKTAASLPVLGTLACKLVPGIHITLLRLPMLELALAEQQPDRTLYIIQPSETAEGGQATVLKREGGARGWKKLRELPEAFHLSRDIVILRNYCGYIPPFTDDASSLIYRRPLITEDHYLLGINDLESILPVELADSLKGELNVRPTLLLRLSMLTWHHRMLLYQLFGRRPLQLGSVVVLEPGETERELWEGRRIPPAKEVRVLELSDRDLEMALEAVALEDRGPEAP